MYFWLNTVIGLSFGLKKANNGNKVNGKSTFSFTAHRSTASGPFIISAPNSLSSSSRNRKRKLTLSSAIGIISMGVPRSGIIAFSACPWSFYTLSFFSVSNRHP